MILTTQVVEVGNYKPEISDHIFICVAGHLRVTGGGENLPTSTIISEAVVAVIRYRPYATL